jgi:glycosyltransferase involved in cell wall biosynthesis
VGNEIFRSTSVGRLLAYKLARRRVFALADRIWIDVEDLFKYAEFGYRPTGIPRLLFELCLAIQALPESKDRVFFVRHDATRQSFRAISWDAVEVVYSSIVGRRTEKPGSLPVIRPVLKRAIDALPDRLRRLVLLQGEVFVGLADLMKIFALRIRRRRRLNQSAGVASGDDFAVAAKPGDILAVFGFAWLEPGYNCYVERAKREKGVRFAALIYDIIPLRRPDWFGKAAVKNFRDWLTGTLLLADWVLTISAFTARDVCQYAQEKRISLRAAPTPIPLGTGLRNSDAAKRSSAGRPASSRLPAANSYALIVATIEVRKNHALLFEVWRRLLRDMPAESVPTLVFAGRVGWLVSDLMEQLRHSGFLDGKIVHIESPTDEELETLYGGCLFTLFPSFYEGWGLPVTESLAFGRPCIISKATSLPEAGGSLARYIDPDNTTDAYRVIRDAIEDPDGLLAWRDRVRCEFRPVEWSESAHAVLGLLDSTQDASAPAESKLRRSA